MIGQYLLLMGIIFAGIFVLGQVSDIAPTAYKDMFVSVTVPYIIGAALYYISFFWQIKKANEIFSKL